MAAYCMTPYWIKKDEKTNLKLLNYSYQRFILWRWKESGEELEPEGEDSWCGNWFSATVLLRDFFLGGDPRGQFLIHLGQGGHAICHVWVRNLFRSQKLRDRMVLLKHARWKKHHVMLFWSVITLNDVCQLFQT